MDLSYFDSWVNFLCNKMFCNNLIYLKKFFTQNSYTYLKWYTHTILYIHINYKRKWKDFTTKIVQNLIYHLYHIRRVGRQKGRLHDEIDGCVTYGWKDGQTDGCHKQVKKQNKIIIAIKIFFSLNLYAAVTWNIYLYHNC